MTPGQRGGVRTPTAENALTEECVDLCRRQVRLNGELDRIEDEQGIGARYYAKLDELTETREALGRLLRARLERDDIAAIEGLERRLQRDPSLSHALRQTLKDQVDQYLDADAVRHELFLVPLLLPAGLRSTVLDEGVREAIAQAWMALADGRDSDPDDVTVSVDGGLHGAGAVFGLDAPGAFRWNAHREAPRLASAADAPVDTGLNADTCHHWDGDELALRFLAIHVTTEPERLDEDDDADREGGGGTIPADDLRPYHPNFVDAPASLLTWSATCRKALSRLTRGHLNVGFPDDALAASGSGRYFMQFWLARYGLAAQLQAIGALEDVAELTVSAHAGADATAPTELRISLLDDDGDLLAGWRIELGDGFEFSTAQPIAADLAKAFGADEITLVPGLSRPPEDASDIPLFHTRSGWRPLEGGTS